MPWKYKYEGKDKNGNKKFSKTYKKQKWVPDYENNCVRDYEKYINESINNGSLSQSEIKYVSYFEGSYENACKFFHISGESCKIYNKETNSFEIKEDSLEIKIERLEKVVIKNQTTPRYVPKSSAELFTILTSKMNEQYYFVSLEKREETAIQIITNCYSLISAVDISLMNYINLISGENLNNNHIDIQYKKRANRLFSFLKKNISILNLFNETINAIE